MFSSLYTAGCSSSNNNSNQQENYDQNSRPSTSSSTSSSMKFNFTDAINSFQFIGNIKNSLDGISKNVADMNKLFNLSVNKISCNSCNISLNIFRKCSKCSLVFCSQCMVYNPIPLGKSICNRCIVFSQRPISKEALTALKIRDLKWFLNSRNISSHHFYEKSEIIDMIISITNGTSETINPSQQHRHSANVYSSSSTTGVNESSTNSSFINDGNVCQASSSSTFYSENNNENQTSNSSQENKSQLTSITLNDIISEDEIKSLPVQQLKQLLAKNFVNFKGCVERDELVAKVLFLYHDKKKNDALKDQIEKEKPSSGVVNENQCKICWEKVIDCVLLDCGHMLSCTDCGKVLSECPVCRQFIVRVVHVFKS